MPSSSSDEELSPASKGQPETGAANDFDSTIYAGGEVELDGVPRSLASQAAMDSVSRSPPRVSRAVNTPQAKNDDRGERLPEVAHGAKPEPEASNGVPVVATSHQTNFLRKAPPNQTASWVSRTKKKMRKVRRSRTKAERAEHAERAAAQKDGVVGTGQEGKDRSEQYRLRRINWAKRRGQQRPRPPDTVRSRSRSHPCKCCRKARSAAFMVVSIGTYWPFRPSRALLMLPRTSTPLLRHVF